MLALRKDIKGIYTLKMYTPLSVVDNKVRVSDGLFAEREYLKNAKTSIASNYINSIGVLTEMRNPFVFDIIYQPKETLLLSLSRLLGYQTLNGIAMNLEQAVIAFDKAVVSMKMRGSDREEIRETMKQVW